MVEDTSLAHGVARFLHLILFVYWLGGDAGVSYAARFVRDSSRSREARLMAAKIFHDLDMLPRYCMALMITSGGILAETIGIEHPVWEMVAIVLLGPVWLGLVLYTHAKAGTDAGRQLARIDIWFRWIVIASIVASVVQSNLNGRFEHLGWLSAKLLIFAFLIFCGVMIRRHLPPYVEAFRTLKTTGPTPESDAMMTHALSRTRPWVRAIWVGVAACALIGVLKPAIG